MSTNTTRIHTPTTVSSAITASNPLPAPNVPFIPTPAQWQYLYDQWHGPMAKSLRKSGSAVDCEEAVQEAFLKFFGLSANLHLSVPLTPIVEGCWYMRIKFQARGILSHLHQRQRRFVQLPEDRSIADAVADAGRIEAFMAAYRRGSVAFRRRDMDRAWFRREVHRAVDAICREAGVCERNLKAYKLNVFDEMSAAEIVREIGNGLNENNLYQIKKRIETLLAKHRNRFRAMHDELLAA